ncbi:MAG: hypothetical protein ACPF8V_06550 [Luteibaculum sp.]
MLKRKLVAATLALLSCILLEAQNNIQSPFSRYGVGDLVPNGTVAQRALGSTGIALNPREQINLINPAHAVFLSAPVFNVSGTSSFTTINGFGSTYKQSYSGLNSISLAFPVQNKWAFQFGLRPYSNIGYDLQTTTQVDTNTVFANYSGSGGTKNVFLAIAYDFFSKSDSTHFVISAQFDHYFGPLTQTRSLFTDALPNGYGIRDERNANLNGSGPKLGVLYTFYPNKTKPLEILAGATYHAPVKLSGEQEIYSYTFLRNFNLTPVPEDTIAYTQTDNNSLRIPQKFGLGIGLNWKDKLRLGIDYTVQDWSNFEQSFEQDRLDGSFRKFSRLSFGAHYTPSSNILFNEPLWNFITYSVGAWTSESYVNYNDNLIREFGTSFGLRFPFRKSRSYSSLQIGMEYVVRGYVSQNLIQEKNTRIIFGLNLSPNFLDRWFYKRKYD